MGKDDKTKTHITYMDDEQVTEFLSFRDSLRKLLPGILLRYTRLGVAALALVTIITFFARWNRFAELATHFAAVYFGCAIIGAATTAVLSWKWRKTLSDENGQSPDALARARSNATCLTALVLALIHGVAVLPWYLPPAEKPPPGAQPNLRIMSANVHTSNADYEALIQLVRDEKPDLLLLQEIDRAWHTALEPLKDLYPHAISRPRSDNFGIALYSRLPLDDPTINDLSGEGVPGIETRITVNGQTLTILNYHTLPPVGADYVTTRNKQLAALAPWVRQQPGPVIITGDLNVTMWSPYYKDTLAQTGLRDTRRGFGIRPTWPAFYPVLKIPLDYCLTSPGIHTLDFRTAPNTGSDHLPIIIDLYVPAD